MFKIMQWWCLLCLIFLCCIYSTWKNQHHFTYCVGEHHLAMRFVETKKHINDLTMAWMIIQILDYQCHALQQALMPLSPKLLVLETKKKHIRKFMIMLEPSVIHLWTLQ
jgi:hypothetical protein